MKLPGLFLIRITEDDSIQMIARMRTDDRATVSKLYVKKKIPVLRQVKGKEEEGQ